MSAIGTSVRRRRDAELIAGRGRYVADLALPGQAWLRVVRSPFAHARLVGVDVSAAAALPGVVGVFTAADLPDVRLPIRLPFASTPAAELVLQPVLAQGVVRYVGEPVAIVLAEDPYVAEDAAELVVLDLDPLDAAVDPLADTAGPLVHEALASNVVETVPLRFGDVEAAFARADVVVRRRLAVQRHTAVPLETRGLVAEPDPTGARLTLWGAAKVKHYNRAAIAGMLGLDPAALRLVELDVGGGFGVRGELYPEDVLVPWAALRLGRPVKWVEDRAEHLVATNHAREQVHDVAVAATVDGRLLGLTSTAWVDQGAYVRTQGILPALLPAFHLPGPYVWEAFDVVAHAVLTHRTPVGTYRGPGMTEASFVRERALDLVAGELGLDPIELRRRNLVPAERMPFVYDLGAGTPPIVYESGDFPAAFERLLLRARVDAERQAGHGVGVAAVVEMGGIGPFEEASIETTTSGGVIVRAGVGSLGQGIETALAQIAADELGVGVDAVTVLFRDTDDVASGFGSFASRSVVVAGGAVVLAARELKRRAAELLEVDPTTVDIEAHAVELTELGRISARFEKEHPSFSFGAAASVVDVTADTGRVRVVRHVVAHDVGRAVNPELVHGQLAGAAAQGIGGALFEELRYDEDGNPLVVSLADYLMPTAHELPEIETILIEHPYPGSPIGAKGAGEAGIVATPAAVANAVADALGSRGTGVDRLPLTPARVRALLRAAPQAADEPSSDAGPT